MTYLMCFLWGYQDGSINIHIFQILGFEFKNQIEPFSVFNLVQGFSIFVGEFAQSFLDIDQSKGIIMYSYICLAFGIISCSITYFFPYNPMSRRERWIAHLQSTKNGSSTQTVEYEEFESPRKEYSPVKQFN